VMVEKPAQLAGFLLPKRGVLRFYHHLISNIAAAFILQNIHIAVTKLSQTGGILMLHRRGSRNLSFAHDSSSHQ